MAKQPRSLHGRVVAITGGGRGIGQAIAQSLAAEGCRVAVGDLDAASAQETAAALGGDAVGLRLDVTDHAGFSAFLDEVEQRLGPLDVLVNNAGIMPVGPLEYEDDATAVRLLEINLHAVIHGTKQAIRRMRPRGTGHIVNVASSAGKTGFPNLATYCATKHGVVGLSEAVRAELRGTGVEISVVMPGIVKTELSSGMTEARGVKNLTPEQVAAEVVGALEIPRFDVFVPRSTGPLLKFAAILPRRAREAMAHVMRADTVATTVDLSARAAYESRVAASGPTADKVTEVQIDQERSAA